MGDNDGLVLIFDEMVYVFPFVLLGNGFLSVWFGRVLCDGLDFRVEEAVLVEFVLEVNEGIGESLIELQKDLLYVFLSNSEDAHEFGRVVEVPAP